MGIKEEFVSGVMPIPSHLDVSFQSKIDSIHYNKLKIVPFSGTLAIKQGGLFLKDGNMGLAQGSARLEGFYRPIAVDKALFSLEMVGKEIDIDEAYSTIELLQELIPAAERASGRFGLNYAISGNLDAQMLPIMASLEGKGTLYGNNIRFDGYKLMSNVSKASGFDALNNPNMSGIKVTSTLKNNILDIERFKFKVQPFRLRAEGQTSLDGELNLKMRIGLPPFGIIGIPVTVTGDSDEPIIKLGRKSSDLEATEYLEDNYSEEELRRMTLLKTFIRDGMSPDEIEEIQDKVLQMQLDSIPVLELDSLSVKQ